MICRDPIEMVNEYIKRFGAAVSVELHPLDADGYTDLRYDSLVIGVNAFADRDLLLILARMGPAPEHDGALYRKLLELNFLATQSCSFAIDEQRKLVYLRAMRSLDGLDYEEFAGLLATVAAVGNEMRARVAELVK
jgi:Tir chaperone protein (CesT) family